MKHSSAYLILLCVWLFGAACTDNSYRGVEIDDEFVVERIPVMVSVGGGHDDIIQTNSQETKGSGSIDENDGENVSWDTGTVYVYAFWTDMKGDFSITSAEDNEYCLLDNSVDFPDPGHLGGGKKARRSGYDSYLLWEGNDRIVYYPASERHTYAFYAYYLDDIVLEDGDIIRDRHSVKIDIEIDGRQDVMSAYADPVYTQQDGMIGSKPDETYLYSYSAFTAKRGIHPVFQFKHHLTRLKFLAQTQFQDEPNNILIQEMSVRSMYKAKFTVAHYNNEYMGLEFIQEDTTNLVLSEVDGSRLNPENYVLSIPTDINAQGDKIKIGGSLLVAPQNDYILYLTLKEENTGKTYTNELIIEYPDGFMPGSEYEITLKIWGLMDVSVAAELTEWNSGGDSTIDTEIRPETNQFN